jgi:hypothetical protein
MTLSIGGKVTDNIQVIVSIDPAVNCSEDEYANYLDDLDEGRLNLNGEEPTRFVLKKVLDYRSQEKISKGMVSANIADGRPSDMNLNVSGLPELRASLVDITNPGEGLEFRKDKDDNLVSRDLVALLNSVGAADELLVARRNAVKSMGRVSKKS